MEPVETLSLVHHGFMRARRNNRWFIHVSPAEELFVYNHKKFLENPQYKKMFEEKGEDIRDHIIEECDGKPCIMSEELLKMVFPVKNVVSTLNFIKL